MACRLIQFRLQPAPSRTLPLNVRSAGHYVLPAGNHERRAPGRFFQLFWSIAGAGRIRVGAVSHGIRPGMVFHYQADEPHELVAGPEGWEYRWLTFDGPHFGRIVGDYGFARVQSVGPCPADLFARLEERLRDATAAGEFQASVLAYEILLLAASPRTVADTEPGDAAKAKAWLDAHFTDARLNVSALAARLRLHRATLHRVFVKNYGVPPVRYLGRLRLRLALELLVSTSLPIATVAVRCGLPDVAHFSRLIARHTGQSPRTYRQQQRE